MATVTICSDFGALENTVAISTVSPSIYHEVMGPDAMILDDQIRIITIRFSFLNVELEANFFTLLFDFHQEAF